MTKKKWFYRSKKHLWVLGGCFAFWIIFSLGIHLLKKETLLFSLCMAGFILIILLLVCLKHYLLWNHLVKRLVWKYGYTLEDAMDEAWESTFLGRFWYWH
jgi:hypothetical protein